MHELPVTESILNIALRHAQEARAQRITDIYLVIGDLSSYIDDSVRFYWDMVSEGTLAEGAELHFRRIPAELECLECQTRYRPADDDLSCPTCRSHHVKVLSGDEFLVDSIEIDLVERAAH